MAALLCGSIGRARPLLCMMADCEPGGYLLDIGRWYLDTEYSSCPLLLIRLSVCPVSSCVSSQFYELLISSHDQSPDTCQQCLNSDRECWLQCIFGYSEVLTLLWLSCAHIKFYLSKSYFSAWKLFLCVIYRQTSTILTQLKRNFVIIFLFMRWNMWAADVQSSRAATCEARC